MNRICGYNCEHNKGGVCEITCCNQIPFITTTIEDDNNTASKLINYYQVKEGTTMYYEWYVKHLQQENEKLKNIIEHKPFFDFTIDIYDELEDYKSRIEKAVEYIKTCNPDVDLNSMFLNESYISNYGANDLLNILNGKE